ncbi:MAG: ornithine cyclodeaminase family protein [Janthinobacterium lividum]
MRNDARLLLLDRDQVEQLLDPGAVTQAVHEAFVLHSQGEGRNFPVVRERLAAGGIFGIKSGDVAAQGLLGFKAAGFWPANRDQGGEPHQATIMLVDPAIGRPVCLIDGNTITTVRTGAAGGLGLQFLAPENCTDLCIFGTGVQARIQLDFALQRITSLRTVRYVTSRGDPDAAFEASFAGRCAMVHASDRDDAVAASRIVITATPGKGALFSAAAVQPGTHLNCVGADTRGKRELPDGLLPRARLFVDDREQALRIGEAQWAPETDCIELGALLTGAATFRRQPGDITVFDMTGLSLQDLTVARMLHERARATTVGTSIAWPW